MPTDLAYISNRTIMNGADCTRLLGSQNIVATTVPIATIISLVQQVAVPSQWIAWECGTHMVIANMNQISTSTKDAKHTVLLAKRNSMDLGVLTVVGIPHAQHPAVLSLWTALEPGATMMPATTRKKTMRMSAAASTV